jgi:Zn-dependent peptidase ImmA (M78 family)/transcriptional regulator with XRE-family HTH domain
MSALDTVSPVDVGERLRIARDNADITQKDAADKINIARTTLVAIEKGQRRIRIDELQQLAKLYGTSVNALLRREAVHVDLVPRFRKPFVPRFRKPPDDLDAAADRAAEIMSRLAKAEIELENLLGIERVRNYLPERPILQGDVREQAENNAIELRERLGLGNAPIGDIVTLLEMEMGVRVYVRRLDSRISGLFAYDDELGPFILLNANHPRERRTQTAAHETGHFLSTRRQPEVLHINEMTNSREERYADAFGRAFLTPSRAVKQKYREITAGSDQLTRRHVIVLAHFFGVAREAMVRRLEELSLTKNGTWDWFQANGGITDQHARQVLGDLSIPDAQKAEADRPTTLRLNLLAAEAYRRQLLSEGQLARLLDIDRIELREIMDDLEIEGSEADATPNILG